MSPAAEPPPLKVRPRRAPSSEERQRDADRSRQRLLAAALDEFAAHGYAGARVSSIAARAGLNPQLITYYFGGKPGLYEALNQRWLEQEAATTQPSGRLEDLIASYLPAVLDDPRMARLLLWDGLTNDDDPANDGRPAAREDLSELQRRQADGEIAGDLDPGLLQLALMGATLAPVAIPQVARRITGLDPTDPEFRTRYDEHLRRIVRHLAEPGPPSTGTTGK
ncbi:MAG: TetR family transcriptional regulator [Humibacillus sp.]|nr:TetR family transcriptional regulator [Humibacillus sp.]MDN5776271.1 TetR family transcriptional regulator [Humibacillus sp.]